MKQISCISNDYVAFALQEGLIQYILKAVWVRLNETERASMLDRCQRIGNE